MYSNDKHYHKKVNSTNFETIFFQTKFLHIKQTTSGFISGYASRFDIVDHHQDIITKGAFAKTLRSWHFHGRWPKMLWQHNPRHIIGHWTHLAEDDKGLYVEGQLLLDIPKAQQAYLLLKKGIIDGLSIGFHTVQSTYNPETKIRTLTDLNLIEISLVTFAANRFARVDNIKSTAFALQ